MPCDKVEIVQSNVYSKSEVKNMKVISIVTILIFLLIGCSSTPVPDHVTESKVSETVEKIEKSVDRLEMMDDHALEAPDSVKSSMVNLVDYLIEPAQTDLEKVRVIYRWITDNIAYDTDAFFSGQYGDTSPEGVLSSGKSICSGYSGLYKNLLDLAGVTSVEISGYAKGYGYTEGKTYSRTNHAWNAVNIEGEWYFIDTTWASGAVNGRDYIKRLEEFWFLTPPDQYIFSHLPEDPQWQLIDQVVSKERFEELPNIRGQFFNLGISSNQLMEELNSEKYRDFPKFYTIKSANLTAMDVPLFKYLEKDKIYIFTFYSEDIKSIALIEKGKFIYFDQEDGEFSISFRPSLSGIIQIGYSTIGKTSSHHIVIQYEVE